MRRAAVLVCTFVCALTSACSPPASRAPDELRVLSLSPSITRVLLELGARDAIVGVDRYSAELPGMRGVPSLGGLFAPDVERALELRPSLALGVQSEQQRGFFELLRARGIPAHELEPHTLAEVLDSFREIGRLVGRPEAGQALAARVARDLEALAAATGPVHPRVALVVHHEPLYVIGSGSFVSQLIAVAGGRNVFDDLDAPYPQVSLEALAERRPDVVIDTTFADTSPESRAAAERHWSRFSWVRDVRLLPQGSVALPGPDLVTAARRIRAALGVESAREPERG